MTVVLRVCRPVDEDIRRLLELRNEPETCAQSFHQEPREWDSFRTECLENDFQASCPSPLFGEVDGVAAGYVRFKRIEDPTARGLRAVEISVAVDSNYRRRGIANEMLKQSARWPLPQEVDLVLAEIRPDNRASIRCFEKAGYRFLRETTVRVPGVREAVPVIQYVLDFVQGFTLGNGRRIGPGEDVFIIAEAGSNWRMGAPARDREMGFALIDAATEAGCDAVKFQTYRPETVYVENAGESDYLSKAGIQESIRDIFQDLSMPYELVGEFAEHAKQCGILFMSSPFSVHDAEAVDPHVLIHKIASYEIAHPDLLQWVAQSGKPLILSTGAADTREIDWALDVFEKSGGNDVLLMQCTAKYPCPLESLNVKALADLRERYRIPVGLSDHSRNPIVGPATAVAMGANCIEKHFTLHNALPGPDHAFAVTPDELKQLVQAVRDVEQAVGGGRKEVQAVEAELRDYAQRSLQATCDIRSGEVLQIGKNYDVLRSGKQEKGLHPRHLDKIEGRHATRDIPLGDGLREGDYA